MEERLAIARILLARFHAARSSNPGAAMQPELWNFKDALLGQKNSAKGIISGKYQLVPEEEQAKEYERESPVPPIITQSTESRRAVSPQTTANIVSLPRLSPVGVSVPVVSKEAVAHICSEHPPAPIIIIADPRQTLESATGGQRRALRAVRESHQHPRQREMGRVLTQLNDDAKAIAQLEPAFIMYKRTAQLAVEAYARDAKIDEDEQTTLEWELNCAEVQAQEDRTRIQAADVQAQQSSALIQDLLEQLETARNQITSQQRELEKFRAEEARRGYRARYERTRKSPTSSSSSSSSSCILFKFELE
jgi:hypothetical protein